MSDENMGRHRVGEFTVEVIHQEDREKPEVVIVVRLGCEFVEQAVFDFVGFNSGELRRRLSSLEAFTIPRLDAVIEDARKWLVDEDNGEHRKKVRGRPALG